MLPYRPNFPLSKNTFIPWKFLYVTVYHAQIKVELLTYLTYVNTSVWENEVIPAWMQFICKHTRRRYVTQRFLYLSRISMYRNNLIKWEHKTQKRLPAKNVTLPWCLVLVPPGWWNVIICTNRKQTGLWVSGCRLFSLSQAQQHWEPDIRLTQLLFTAQLWSPVSLLWNTDGDAPLCDL